MEEIKAQPGHRFVAYLETDKETISLELMPDRAPKTVANFIRLARQDFFNGLTFHRIVRGFMIQGGCPRGDGTGGPGYTIPAEFNDLAHEKGVISMARGEDPDSAGSQFFIVHAPAAPSLDGAYTAFGKIVEGFDVLDEIAGVPVDWNGSERSRPREKVCIRSLTIAEEPIPIEPEEDSKTEETPVTPDAVTTAPEPEATPAKSEATEAPVAETAQEDTPAEGPKETEEVGESEVSEEVDETEEPTD